MIEMRAKIKKVLGRDVFRASFDRSFIWFVVLWLTTAVSVSAQTNLVFDVTRGDTGGTIGVLNQVGDDLCPTAMTNGCDFDQADAIVRTNDGVGYNFAIQVDPPGDDVYIDTTLKPGLIWDQIPGICQAATSFITGEGTTASPSRLRCELGFRSSFAANLVFVARALGDNSNGATSGIASAEFGGDASPAIVEDVSGIEDVTITAMPHYNVQKRIHSAAPLNHLGIDGYRIRYMFFIDTWKTDTNGDPTDDPDPLFGNEVAAGAVSFVEDATGISGNAYIMTCSRPGSGYFPLATYNAAQPLRSVLNAGNISCSATGPGAQTVTVTVSGADLSLSHYPTQTSTGIGLDGDRRIASFGMIDVFIPLSDIYAAGGQIPTVNEFGNINLMSITGQANFEGAPQDATGGELDEDNTISFLVREGTGGFSHTYRCVTPSNPAGLDCALWYGAPTSATLVWSGDGAAEPSQEFASYSYYINRRFTAVTDAAVCSVFDSRYYEPIPIVPGGDAARCHGSCGTLGVDYIFEYGVGYEATAWRDATTTPSNAVPTECSAPSGWYTTLAAAEAAGDVTKVRMTRLNPLPAGAAFAVSTRLNALTLADLTGVPNGTLMRTWGTATSSGYFTGDWRGCSYTAGEWDAVNHSTNGCGDRVFLSRSLARIEKRTVPGNLVNTVDAGGFVTFELFPSFTSRNTITDNVTIVDSIPVGGIYVPGSATQGGVPFEPVVTGSIATGQTLTWDLGPLVSSEPIETIQFDMRTPLATPNGTNLDNVARIDVLSDESSPEQRSATRRVTVTAPASMLIAKSVDLPVVPQEGAFNYTVEYLNTTAFSFNEMDLIDILPADGDGRFPPSDFSGSLSIVSVTPESNSVQVYFTMDTASGLASDPNLTANDFTTGSTNWCPATFSHTLNPSAMPSNGGPASACPATLSEVTAIRLFDTEELTSGSVRNFQFQVQTTENFGGDLYVNQAQGTSDGITLSPLTPTVQTRVIENGVLGLAKDNVAVAMNVVTFNFRLENLGNARLNNVAIVDDLDATFGAGNYIIEAAPSFVTADVSAGIALNAGFTGTGSQKALLDGSSTLAVGEFAIVELSVRIISVIDLGSGYGVYENSAIATGQTPGGTPVTDISDDGTVTDEDGNGNPSGANEDDPTPVIIVVEPQIEITKTASGALLSDPVVIGDEIEYTFAVENTGNVLLSNVTLVDPLFTPSDITASCIFPEAVGFLKPGQTANCTERYSIVQADIDNAGVTNTAVATGDGPTGSVEDHSDSGNVYDETGADDDPTTIPLYAPSVQIVKTATSAFSNPVTVGDKITYSLVVTNTGNIDLTNIVIDDNLTNADGTTLAYDSPGLVWLSSTDGSPVGSIIAGESATYSAVYSLTLADINSGRIENQAEVTGDNEAGTPVSDISDDPTDPTDTLDNDDPADPTIIDLSPVPSITVIKSVEAALDTNGDGLYGGEDDVVVYKFLVTNTGNVSMSLVTVTDPFVTVNGGPINLDAGEADALTFIASYTVTAADIARGYIENTAMVSGTDPSGTIVTDVSDTGTDPEVIDIADPENTESEDGAGNTDDDPTNDPTVLSVPSNPLPQLELIKLISDVTDINGSGLTDEGDLVTYTFTVRNVGNVNLSEIVISDPMLALSGNPIPLIPVFGEDVGTVSGTYTIEATDVAAGGVENTATATGFSVNSLGDPIRDPDTGEQLETTDTSDTGTEPGLGSDGYPVVVGDPGATETPDLGGATDSNPSNDPTLLLIPLPSIAVEKSMIDARDTNGDGLFGGSGDELVYAFAVTNTGNTILANILVVDPLVAVSGGPITLAPGGIDDVTFTATYTVTDADIIRGYVENTATISGDAVNASGDPVYGPSGDALDANDTSDTGSDEFGGAIDDPETTETPDGTGTTDSDPANDPTITSVPLNPVAGIQIVKSAIGSEDTNGDAVEGGFDDLLTYSFAVTNTGNYPLSNVEIVDPLLGGLIDTISSIAVGDTITITAQYLLTYEDFAAGSIQNQATATGSLVTPTGDSIRDRITGEPITVSDISDTGTERDLSVIGDPESTENEDIDGVTDDDPTNDPTLTDLPIVPSGAGVSGIVFLDVDGDGVFTPGTDDLLSNFVVTLYDDLGRVMGTGTTNADGFYEITGFPVGNDYQLVFIDPVTNQTISEITNLDFGSNTVLTDQNALIVDVRQADIVLIKTTLRSEVLLGDTVPYTISVINNGTGTATGLIVTDQMPDGLRYISGTASIDGVPVEPTISGRTQTFDGIQIRGGQMIEITLSATVLPTAPFGIMTNTARVIDPPTGETISTGTASVQRLPEHVFDCSDIVGRVFNDRNFNGYQDDIEGLPAPITVQEYFDDKFEVPVVPDGPEVEEGLANVRLATPTGTIITTDAYGRFSVPCAELAEQTGTNFTLKVDTRTLPTGFRMTTENPRTMRVTAGIMTEMNFGAALGRVLDIDLTAAAFNGDEPVERLHEGLERILLQIARTPTVIRLSYFTNGEGTQAANRRLDRVEEMIRDEWRDIGSYRLIIERAIAQMQ